MKIEVNEKGEIILKEVFSGIGFVSESKEELGVCMRDSGFEINYGGKWYSLQRGELELMK